MVEETPQINPVDPDPGTSTAPKGKGSPWKTNGVVSQPSFTPAASARGDAPDKSTAHDAPPAPEATAAGPEADPEGTQPRATQAEANDAGGAGGADDGAIFLASLARAMQDAATTERTRVSADTDQRRDAHIAAINTRRESEQTRMQELADEDRKAIDDWVAAEQQRIQDEKARRTAALEADLKTSLGEHGAKIDREIERVEAAIVVYRSDVDTYFARLEGDTDPLVIAQHASRRPVFPDLEKIGRSADPATEATATSTDDGPAATDQGAGSSDGAATAVAASTPVASDPPSNGAGGTAGDGGGTVDAIADATNATAAEPPSAATTEPVAISAAKAVGVMEASKPPTKLAQAWAAWNESTKNADAAAADQAAKEQAEVESFTLTPPAPTSAEPAPAPADKASASSNPSGTPTAPGSVAVAAGTWKPPVQDTPQSLAGGAMNWLRRDRDRDQGGH